MSSPLHYCMHKINKEDKLMIIYSINQLQKKPIISYHDNGCNGAKLPRKE